MSSIETNNRIYLSFGDWVMFFAGGMLLFIGIVATHDAVNDVNNTLKTMESCGFAPPQAPEEG